MKRHLALLGAAVLCCATNLFAQAVPDLTITKSHTGNFTQGQTGTYSLTVSNIGGSPTSGSVTVTDNVPVGLVPTSASGHRLDLQYRGPGSDLQP